MKEQKKNSQTEAKRLAAMAKIVESFASKDETRKNLLAPFHDKKGGVVVATDGRALIATKHGYNPDVKNNPDFPASWRQVVPRYKDAQTIKVNPAEIVATCAKGRRLANAINSGVHAYMVIPLTDDGGNVVLAAEILHRVAKAMEADNITEIKAVDGTCPILAQNATTTLVQMPVRNGGRGGVKLTHGRGTSDIYFDALTGRVISAPERSDTGKHSRAYADELRDGVEKMKANGGSLLQIKKDLAEIARIEKRIAAEDEIDALMGTPATPAPAPAEAPAAPAPAEAAKPPRKASKPRKAAPAPEPEAPAVQPSAWTLHASEWRDMTHRNCHDDVRIAISEWAAANAPSVPEFAMIAADFHLIAARDDGDGYDVNDYMIWRNDTTDEMLDRIGETFGSEAKAGIAKCL